MLGFVCDTKAIFLSKYTQKTRMQAGGCVNLPGICGAKILGVRLEFSVFAAFFCGTAHVAYVRRTRRNAREKRSSDQLGVVAENKAYAARRAIESRLKHAPRNFTGRNFANGNS